MTEWKAQIEGVEWKIQKLIQKMRLLKQENAALLEENIRSKQELDHHKKNIANLETQLNRTKDALENTQDNGTDRTKLLKEEIDHYINEIDKCLEWLQNI